LPKVSLVQIPFGISRVLLVIPALFFGEFQFDDCMGKIKFIQFGCNGFLELSLLCCVRA
jgi:hypothetical protein